MSLRDQAAADARAFLADTVGGFAHPITLTSPDGVSAVVPGITAHVHTTLDPQTGAVVTGERVSATFALAALRAAAFAAVPTGTTSQRAKPWVASFADTVGGRVRTWKVADARPDHTLGIVVCMLEHYATT